LNKKILEQEVKGFNERFPVGTRVHVRKDLGELLTTRTRSEAWALSGHTPVVMLEGISGCYLLSRITPIEDSI
jgi:hypothetical protein